MFNTCDMCLTFDIHIYVALTRVHKIRHVCIKNWPVKRAHTDDSIRLHMLYSA